MICIFYLENKDICGILFVVFSRRESSQEAYHTVSSREAYHPV